MDEKYFSANEIAKKFNVHISSVSKWIREGKLKAVKLGKIWRIPESALQEFIKSSEEKEK